MQRLAGFGAALAAAIVLSACGGGGGSSSSSSTEQSNTVGGSSNTSNQVALTVGPGAANVVNMPTTSVTVCAPGGSPCQTIQNVLVDTGSYGLRLVNSAASSVLGSLPVETSASGAQLAECGQFVTSYTWGSVRLATVKLAGETASSIPIQILGDLGSSNVPSSCSNGLTQANTVAQLGANGIIGVGVAPNDCGAACAVSTSSSTYYACASSSSCSQTTVAQSKQVANVVANFAADNNGVVISLGNPSGGTASGTLTFGVNTQANNTVPGSATRMTTDSAGDVSGTLSSTSYSTAFLDTGSNGYFFKAPSGVSLPTCSDSPDFYCPSATTTLAGTVTGLNGSQESISVSIANGDQLFNSGGYALAGLGGTFDTSGVLDLGLPFFFGRNVYFGFDESLTTGTAPYAAF
jgi:hypothetical protein